VSEGQSLVGYNWQQRLHSLHHWEAGDHPHSVYAYVEEVETYEVAGVGIVVLDAVKCAVCFYTRYVSGRRGCKSVAARNIGGAW